MLTITRKRGEGIRIGESIIVLVKEIRRNQVRIGVSAEDIPVLRDEHVHDVIGAIGYDELTRAELLERCRTLRKTSQVDEAIDRLVAMGIIELCDDFEERWRLA